MPRQHRKTDQIYESLRRSIVRLDLAPGAPIHEKEMCALYGASRTPLREAVQRLADEGLVEVRPQSGTFVRRISFAIAEEGFVIRRALEIESVRRAAERIDTAGLAGLGRLVDAMRTTLAEDRLSDYIDVDDAFHAAIAGASGLPRVWKFISLAKVHLDRMRHLSTPLPGYLAEITEQHAMILAAMERHSPEQAELAMRIHLDFSFDVMRGLHETRADIFHEDRPS
jgi:DNA-binding GntR family transcriptional regulator